MTEHHHEFEKFARTKLNETVEKMDSASASKLAVIRRRALNTKTSRSSFWKPSMALGVAIAAFMLIWVIPQERPDDSFDTAFEDVEILASDTDFEVLEDMDFYQWLEQNNGLG